MAQVTVELGRLLQSNFKLFDFDYVFDDADFKAQMEQQLLDFFYDYEIGQETPDMFKRKFIARWNRIMPYYNKLYNTTLLNYNPLSNYSMTEALEQLSTTNSSSAGNSNGTSESSTFSDTDTKASDYPQQPIAGGDYLAGASNTISSNTGNAKNTDSVSSTSNSTSNMDYNKTIEGITGTAYPDLIKKHRDALIRINDMIIEEMKPCFILIY